jgi:hypothetical protein
LRFEDSKPEELLASAKKQAEEKAYENDLINRMAKIDSAGIKKEDVADFKKMYDEYVNFGSSNLKRLNDPEVQVKLRQMENSVRGFVTQSKAEKETDLKLMSYLSPDYADDSRGYVQQFIGTRTLDRNGKQLDYTKIKKFDDKDYISEAYKGFDGSVIKEIGSTTYKNTPELFGEITNKATNYLNSIMSTPTGERAFRQFVKSSGMEVSTPQDSAKALEQFKDALVANFVARAEQSVTSDEPKKESQFDMTLRLGFNPTRVPVLQERLTLLDNVFRGDQAANNTVAQFLGEGAKIENNPKSDVVKVTVPIYKDGARQPDRVLNISKKNGGKNFIKEFNGILERLGTKYGYADINMEELGAFSNAIKYNPTMSTVRPNPMAPITQGVYNYGNAPTSKPKRSGGLADEEFK